MDRNEILHGIRIGRHDFHPEEVMEWIDKNVIAYGLNFMRFSVRGVAVEPHYFREWARYLSDNKIYFAFQGCTKQEMGFDRETALEMKKIAGKYYLCNLCKAELGTKYGCFNSGFGYENDSDRMSDGKLRIEKLMKEFSEDVFYDDSIPNVSIEATSLISYIEKDNGFPLLETFNGDPEVMIPLTRGVAKANGKQRWGTYMAHEWYAGTRNFDTLKMKRLSIGYNYAYLSGSNMFVLESGNEDVCSQDTYREGKLGYDHEICREYRQFLKNFGEFIREDKRPSGNPEVKFAFVQGNLDGYSPFRCGGYLWNSYNNEEFAYSDPEYMWRLFESTCAKRSWTDIHNFGDHDFSGAVGYGLYDIIPATAPYEVMAQYDYLVFVGWNTMTEEIYENLKKFVKKGGKLFMTAAHLNTSDKRDGEMKLIRDGKVSDLFGCDLDAENPLHVNRSYTFFDSIVPGLMYPYVMEWFAEGYLSYARVNNCTANHTGKLCTKALMRYTKEQIDSMDPWLTEHKLGDGYAMLMTCLNYPGSSGFSAYKAVVRELMNLSHREAEIKVYGGDKLRFSVYKGERIYLLNTDFDCKIFATVDNGKEKREFVLDPGELKSVAYF